MPRGFRTLNGAKPEYAKLFGVQEHPVASYKNRTYDNVKDSDYTIRFACNFGSPGEICTANALYTHSKPFKDILIDKDDPKVLSSEVFWLSHHLNKEITNDNYKVINIAGNSHATWEGMQKYVTSFLSYVFLSLGYDRVALGPEYKQFAQLGY